MGMVTEQNVKDVCTYHPADENQHRAFDAINVAAEDMIRVLLSVVPECADRSVAIRNIREARMNANSAVALRGLI